MKFLQLRNKINILSKIGLIYHVKYPWKFLNRKCISNYTFDFVSACVHVFKVTHFCGKLNAKLEKKLEGLWEFFEETFIKVSQTCISKGNVSRVSHMLTSLQSKRASCRITQDCKVEKLLKNWFRRKMCAATAKKKQPITTTKKNSFLLHQS